MCFKLLVGSNNMLCNLRPIKKPIMIKSETDRIQKSQHSLFSDHGAIWRNPALGDLFLAEATSSRYSLPLGDILCSDYEFDSMFLMLDRGLCPQFLKNFEIRDGLKLNLKMEKLEEEATKLADQLGLRKDYATVLLAENDWDGKIVVDNWNLPDNALITKAGVVTDPLLETKLVFCCDRCHTVKECKSYGCPHFLCKKCTKEYVEPLTRAGLTNVRCPVHDCDKAMASSVFLVEISADAKKRFNDCLLQKFNIAQARHDYRENSYGFHMIPSRFQHLFNTVQGFLTHLWSNKMLFSMLFLACILICRIIDGGSVQCTSTLSAISLLPSLALVAQAIVVVLLLQLLLSDHVIFTAVLSSVGTAFLLFLGFIACIRWAVRLVLRRT